MLRFVRLIGAAIGVIVALGLTSFDLSSGGFFEATLEGRLTLIAWTVAWAVLGYAVFPYLTVEPARWLAREVRHLSSGEFVAALIGLTLGLLMGLLLGLPLSNLADPFGWLLPLIVSILLGLGTMGLTVAKRQDLWQAALGSGMFGPARSGSSTGPDGAALFGPVVYMDTSAVIDGRITDVVASGFLAGTLVVPRFVLGELQHIADDSDQSRRNRGRRGLEILAALQKDHRVDLELTDEDASEAPTVDEKLVALAERRRAVILTTDYNLNRVAQLRGVRVMNLNQLANAIKPAFLPGEQVHVKVVQQGKEPGQGVAYLEDGTMIVVEGGGSYLERELDVTVVRVLQTVAGRMVFAQPRAS
jgi:uncharacterized protein YacL